MATPELAPWLRTVADPIDQSILDELFGYEAAIDGEFACCHSGPAIEEGLCPEIKPDDVPGVRLVGTRYAHALGWREEWRPTP